MGIDDRVVRAAALVVNAPWTVTRFATDVFRILPLGFDAHVSGRLEIADDLGMTLRAGLRADVFRTGNLLRGDDRAFHGRAGDQANRCD